MAYNKSKHVESAQKYLHQAKVAQAIAEYQTILKHEPKDQVTLMTVGDLYVRQGETFQALEYFERLAKIFLNDGFVAKAIAIYKKIAKLAPEETRPVERLAELYVQQGVLSEARPIYLQLADLHERGGRKAEAAQLLRKLLDAEPDNLRVQTRLAELSVAIGQPADAVAGYLAAAEQLHGRGDHIEAVKYADLALKIHANDLPASTLKARALGAAGRRSDAEELLQSLPELENGGDAAELLLDLYLEAGEFEPAGTLATKIFHRDGKRFASAHRVAASLLELNEFERALSLLGVVREAMTDAGEHELLSQSLIRASERLPGRVEPREWLVELYGRASDSFRLPDALVSLAEAYEAAGQADRARQTYAQLLDRTPDNEGVRRNYKRLQEMNGGHVAVEEPPRAPTKETSPRDPANTEPALDEETQIFVSQSLTDVDLFSSYGLTQKAIDLLEVVRKRAPQHTPTLERLLDLSVGAGDEQHIAELALQLEQIHLERGHAASADRFAQLRQRFERAAERATKETESASTAKPAEFSVSVTDPVAEKQEPGSEAAGVPSHESSSEPAVLEHGQSEMLRAEIGEITSDSGDAGGPDVHELDLSEEWAALAGQFEDSDSGETTAAKSSEFEVTPVPLDPMPEAISEPQAAAEGSHTPAEISPGASNETVREYALEPAGTPASTPASTREGSPLTADDFLESISSELDAVVPAESSATKALPPTTTGAGGDEGMARPSEQETLPQQAMAEETPAQHRGPLNEIFDEFRAGLGEASDEEDPETHYNLGTAYREMGLAEESISEFQKVAQMVEREAARNLSKPKDKRRVFRYAMQCYTLLGLAFMEKGEASIAGMWYARALETPGLDQDSVLALRYDLGVAQELAGDKEAARKSFSQVYGMNIDYRDVAERLAALGKGR